MHRSRSPTTQASPELTTQKRALQLGFPDGWLGTHPLIRGDLAREKLELEAAGYQLDFE